MDRTRLSVVNRLTLSWLPSPMALEITADAPIPRKCETQGRQLAGAQSSDKIGIGHIKNDHADHTENHGYGKSE
jgi:hypothetical protein